jgi:preprotein translocase subunit SecD
LLASYNSRRGDSSNYAHFLAPRSQLNQGNQLSQLAVQKHYKQAIAATQAAIEQQYTEIGKLFDKATLTGGHLKDATPQPVPSEGWEVAIEFDDFGSDAFAKLTSRLRSFRPNEPQIVCSRKTSPDRIRVTKLLYLLCKNSELF